MEQTESKTAVCVEIIRGRKLNTTTCKVLKFFNQDFNRIFCMTQRILNISDADRDQSMIRFYADRRMARLKSR